MISGQAPLTDPSAPVNDQAPADPAEIQHWEGIKLRDYLRSDDAPLEPRELDAILINLSAKLDQVGERLAWIVDKIDPPAKKPMVTKLLSDPPNIGSSLLPGPGRE